MGGISLGDIHNLPTFWVLALFGTFYNFCFRVQTCCHLGGGGGVCVYFLKSARKRRFRNVWVWGGGVDIFQRSTTHGMVHTNTALHRLSIFIQNHCHCQHCFFQAGQTSPCLWTGAYFFNFCQSCNLRAFTGTQPSLRGMAHRPSVVRSTFRCLVNPTLRQGIASLYPDFSHTQPGYTPRASPFARQRLLWCIQGSNSPWREFV